MDVYRSVTDFGAVGDGITDCSPGFQAAADALAGSGTVLYVPAGHFLFNNTVTLSSFLTIQGTPSSTLIGSIAGSYPLNGSIFRSGLSGSPVAYPQLAADVVLGSNTILVINASGIVPGQFLDLQDAHNLTARRHLYRVRAITGAAVTLDRPVLTPFLAGDGCSFYAPSQVPQSIFLRGGGMHVTGSAVIFITLQTAWKCLIEDVLFEGSPGAPSNSFCSFNNASYGCTLRRLAGDASGGCPAEMMNFESSEACLAEGLILKNGTSYGWAFDECVACTVRDSIVTGCSYGYVWGNDILQTSGSDWCSAENCQAYGNRAAGFVLVWGSQYAQIRGGSSSFNGGYGIDTDGVTPPVDASIDGVSLVGNALGPHRIVPGAKRVRLANLYP